MRVKVLPTLLAAAAVVLLVTGVSSASGAASKPKKAHAVVRITTRSVPGLGKILVNSKGRTLYMFVPDKRKKVTCVGGCAVAWPPLKVPAGAKLVGAGGVKTSLLRTDKDPAGGNVATYNGWPLYTYIADRRAGQATGQAVNANGGLWYVLAPSGAVIKAKLHSGGGGSSSGGPTTTSSSGGGSAACSDADGDGDQDAGGPDDGDGCL